MNSRFEGTGVALVTPFKNDLSIDFDGLKKLLDHTSTHVDYFVVHGTTAESPTTTPEEKEKILQFVLKNNSKKLPVVLGIGGNNTVEIIEKLKKTDLSGIAGILSVCPYYNKPSQEGIFQHYKAIAEVSSVPVILYNVPGRTGINMSSTTSARLSEVKNIVGIKDANADINQAIEISKKAQKDFLLISGDDMLAIPFYSIGGKGVISVIANAYPESFCKMINAGKNGDFKTAANILRSYTEINPLLYEEGNPVGVKQVLENLGICSGNVRLPLVPASTKLKERIQAEMKNLK